MITQFTVNKVKGFTLLELLVALVLMGIILSFATLALDSGEDRKIQDEARRITSLIKLAQEESILNDRIIVFKINEAGYQFSYINLDQKEEVFSDPVFRAREFAEYIHPVISIENFLFKSEENLTEDEVFQIPIFPSGEFQTSFRIIFPGSNKEHEITGSLQGTVELVTRDRDT